MVKSTYFQHNMKTLIKLIFAFALLLPVTAMAQQPKLNIRLLAGVNARSFAYRTEGLPVDILAGWQVGGGLRVSKRKAFVNFDVLFVNSGLTLLQEEAPELGLEDDITLQLRAIELPISVGYIPIKSPFFKWFLYGGLANRINLQGKILYLGETTKIKPHDAGLHYYNLGVRFGSQIDIAMFTLDFNYTIGVTNAYRDVIRTNSNEIQLSIGLVF